MAERRAIRKPSSAPVERRRSKESKRADQRGLYVVRVDDRVVVDVILPGDGELMAFVRVDGELLAELPVVGQA